MKNRLNHIIEAQQFDREFLEEIFKITDQIKEMPSLFSNLLEGKIMASFAHEPSTRTRFSFEVAMLKLGGDYVGTESAGKSSSIAKGESLEDTIRILNYYVDVIVLRHPEQGAAKRAAGVSKVPLINGGDGPGEHPTQALLDFYTINDKLGRIDNLSIAMVGDLKYGRTVRSLSKLSGNLDNINLYLVAPDVCKMKKDILDYLDNHDVQWQEETDLNKVLPKVDIVYMTRIQKERFDNNDEYNKAKGKYMIDKKNIDLIPKKSILMHPLPRVDEISSDVDNDPRAIYFEQAKNGLYVRMALLKMLLT